MSTKNLFANINLVRTPLLILTTVLTVTILGSYYLFNRVSFLRGEIKTIQEQNKTFNERILTLETVKPELDSAAAQTAINALPSQNPSMLVVSQINILLHKYELTLVRFELSPINSLVPEMPSEVLLSFNIEGERARISDFLTNLSSITPLVTIRTAKVENREATAEATIEVTSYWSPFPDKLPPLTTAIVGLNETELEIIKSLANYTNPFFSETLAPEDYEPRNNPFSINQLTLPEEEI